MDRLSALKDIADYWRKVKSGELPAPGPNEISITVCAVDDAISKIAELEAKLANREAQPSITDEVIDIIVPSLSLDGLDEEKHHCEWHLYHDRERIRKELREYFAVVED